MDSEFLSSVLNQARNRTLGIIDLIRAAEQLKAAGLAGAVLALYQAWTENNDDNPLLYAILFNYSVALMDTGALEQARGCLERALEINPDFMPAHINLGRLFERSGQAGAAVQQWSRAVERTAAVTGTAISHKTTALNQIARVMEDSAQDEVAESMLRQSLDIDRDQREAVQHYLALRQRQCEWPVVLPWERASREHLLAGMSPLSMAAYADDPMLHLAAAWNYNRRDVGLPGTGLVESHWAAREAAAGGRLRIGYLSSDLREHAVGHLTAELFRQHDHGAIEVFAYYCGPLARDPLHQEFREVVDHWVDITGMGDAEAARRIADDLSLIHISQGIVR